MKKIADWIVDKKIVVFIIMAILTAVAVFGIFQTNVNYDMSKYLPKDSTVKRGMKIMEEEYGEMSSNTVMFDDLTEQEQLSRKTELESIENVKTVVYLQDDETYQKDNNSKYMLTVIVGRCADVILKENTNYAVKSIFVAAPMSYRITATIPEGIGARLLIMNFA